MFLHPPSYPIFVWLFQSIYHSILLLFRRTQRTHQFCGINPQENCDRPRRPCRPCRSRPHRPRRPHPTSSSATSETSALGKRRNSDEINSSSSKKQCVPLHYFVPEVEVLYT